MIMNIYTPYIAMYEYEYFTTKNNWVKFSQLSNILLTVN